MRVRDEAPRERVSDGQHEDEERQIEQVRTADEPSGHEPVVRDARDDGADRDARREELRAPPVPDVAGREEDETGELIREREEAEPRRRRVGIGDVEPRDLARIKRRGEDHVRYEGEKREDEYSGDEHVLEGRERAPELRRVVPEPGRGVQTAEERAEARRDEHGLERECERDEQVREVEVRRARGDDREPAELELAGRRRHAEREQRREQAHQGRSDREGRRNGQPADASRSSRPGRSSFGSRSASRRAGSGRCAACSRRSCRRSRARTAIRRAFAGGSSPVARPR